MAVRSAWPGTAVVRPVVGLPGGEPRSASQNGSSTSWYKTGAVLPAGGRHSQIVLGGARPLQDLELQSCTWLKMWTQSIVVLLTVALGIVGAADQKPTATADNGVFVGVATAVPGGQQTVNRYLGIPYAVTPPVRFSPAVKAPASSSTRSAANYAPACLQQGNRK